MTTEQTTTATFSDQLGTGPNETTGKARQAMTAAQEKAKTAGATVRRHPAPVSAILLGVAGAVAAAVYYSRRRAANASLTRRQKLSAMLHR